MKGTTADFLSDSPQHWSRHCTPTPALADVIVREGITNLHRTARRRWKLRHLSTCTQPHNRSAQCRSRRTLHTSRRCGYRCNPKIINTDSKVLISVLRKSTYPKGLTTQSVEMVPENRLPHVHRFSRAGIARNNASGNVPFRRLLLKSTSLTAQQSRSTTRHVCKADRSATEGMLSSGAYCTYDDTKEGGMVPSSLFPDRYSDLLTQTKQQRQQPTITLAQRINQSGLQRIPSHPSHNTISSVLWIQ